MEPNGSAEEQRGPGKDLRVLLLHIGGGRGEASWGFMVTPNGMQSCGWMVICMVQGRKAVGVLVI